MRLFNMFNALRRAIAPPPPSSRATAPRLLTGVLLSTAHGYGAGAVAVLDGDVQAAMLSLTDTSYDEYMGARGETRPAREAVHYILTKGETLTRECSVKVTP